MPEPLVPSNVCSTFVTARMMTVADARERLTRSSTRCSNGVGLIRNDGENRRCAREMRERAQ